MNLFFCKKKKAALPPETAQQMLFNVFAACNHPQNSVPMEALMSYSNYRRERYAIQRTVIAVMLILFMLLPILFFYGDVSVNQTNSEKNENPTYRISVHALLPIKHIQAHMGERTVPIYALSEDEYVIQPGNNGTMEITIMLVNHQYTTIEFPVSGVDNEMPQLKEARWTEDCLYLYLTDDESGVDFENVYAIDDEGRRIEPVAWDGEKVAFNDPETEWQVFVPDFRGNVLQIQLKAQ